MLNGLNRLSAIKLPRTQTCPNIIILLYLMPDNFTRHGKSAGIQKLIKLNCFTVSTLFYSPKIAGTMSIGQSYSYMK
jgi:hypothetical protein